MKEKRRLAQVLVEIVVGLDDHVMLGHIPLLELLILEDGLEVKGWLRRLGGLKGTAPQVLRPPPSMTRFGVLLL